MNVSSGPAQSSLEPAAWMQPDRDMPKLLSDTRRDAKAGPIADLMPPLEYNTLVQPLADSTPEAKERRSGVLWHFFLFPFYFFYFLAASLLLRLSLRPRISLRLRISLCLRISLRLRRYLCVSI